MSIHVGDTFDKFVVVTTKSAQAATQWAFYHHSCNLYNSLPEGIEKNILGAALDDEYEEMKGDPYIMGVGLYTYQQSLRRA